MFSSNYLVSIFRNTIISNSFCYLKFQDMFLQLSVSYSMYVSYIPFLLLLIWLLKIGFCLSPNHFAATRYVCNIVCHF